MLETYALDPFANYVMQKVIDSAEPVSLNAIFNKLQPQFRSIERHQCGRHIITKIKERRKKFLDENRL